jgi:hypothetical protein
MVIVQKYYSELTTCRAIIAVLFFKPNLFMNFQKIDLKRSEVYKLIMSSDKMIVTGSDFNASQISYTKPKINKSGGKSVGILNNESKKTLHLSTPLMTTWGVNENDYDGKKSYDMSLQFPRDQDANAGPDVAAFLDNMKAFEAKIKADAVKNSKDWLGKAKMNEDVVEALFTPILKYPKDQSTGEPDYSRTPTLRVKLPFWDGKFNVEIYNMDREMIFPSEEGYTPVDLVQKLQNVALVIQCGGLWFANGKFGVTWKLVQAVVQPKVAILGNKTCHVVLSDDARARLQEEKRDNEIEQAITTNHQQPAQAVESSDDEEDEQPAVVEPVKEPSPEPEPVVKPKKKVVRKKKVVAAASS